MKQPKITFIGAGSTVFVKNIIGDILLQKPFRECEINLMDIDEKRLGESFSVCSKIARSVDAQPKIRCFTERRPALEGADFVLTMFQVGGYDPATLIDFEVPKQFGLRQTIGDTLGIGGIMRAVRTVPVMLDIAKDMTELCPEALLLNYVNPMAIIGWCVQNRFPRLRYTGLCHSVQGTISELADDLQINEADIRYTCAGINHYAFYLNLEQRLPDNTYRNLYPVLKKEYASGNLPKRAGYLDRCPNWVRYDLMNRVGYFVTESSEHFSEYNPWYIKVHRPEVAEKYAIPLDEYPRRCVEQIESWQKTFAELQQTETFEVSRSCEYASHILNSVWTGEPCVIYGNLRNDGLIDNLPQGCCVEVPCLVDANGVRPVKIGTLPPHLAALMNTNVNVQSLTVQAILNENREHLYHAAMLDPHTASELDLEQIWQLVDKLIQNHGRHAYLPEYLKVA